MIDTQTDTVLGLVGVGDTPYGIVFNPNDNRLYGAGQLGWRHADDRRSRDPDGGGHY